MQKKLIFVCVAIAASLMTSSARTAKPETQKQTLAWGDEFDGTAGSAPDQAKWAYDLGIGPGRDGWGNNELQTYTNRTENAYLDGEGHLVIKAIRENFTGADGATRAYTSARLVTRGKFEPTYGRIEARIKVPFGQGLWPAFWMLGSNITSVGWPACGEIDVMENIGREPSTVYGTIHGPGYSGAQGLSDSLTLLDGKRYADDFHTFEVEWNPRDISFYIDGLHYHTRKSPEFSGNRQWVFDHPFYLLLNVAVGGNWPGNPDATTVFPQTMVVDYVRVYSDLRAPVRRNRDGQ
ncbi:MAG: glycoside hydrolase family 16 protein [Acidobacteria bacterium]|nr:glycoside hydrolase family 16 protein [Acidobacteriota bacterium]